MALPLSGQLCLSDIRAELGIPSQAPFCLDTAENGGYVALNVCSPYIPSSGNPACVSEWYGYCHTCSCTPSITPTISTTPSVTPSVTRTPSITPTPSTLCCYQYEVTNYYNTSKIVYYTDCNGTPSSISCAGNGLQTYISCAVEGSLYTFDTVCNNSSTDCITWNAANTPCGGCVPLTPTPTPSLTSTPSNPCNSYYSFCLGYSASDCSSACSDYNGCLS